MTDNPFGRQPGPVKITFEGDQRDVDDCAVRLMACCRNNFWEMGRSGNTITFYPRAVND